jgi:hypothetical protein
MLPAFRLVAVSVLFAACVDTPGESITTAPKIAVNKIAVNKLAPSKVAANKVAADKLSAFKLAHNTYSINLGAAGELLSTSDGREVLSLVVACAIPGTITLQATVAGTTFEFPGDLGLVPDWLVQPLSLDGQRWVSACLFARINQHDVVIPISLRGPNPALATDFDERQAFSLEEGGFFGNFFTPKDDPIQAYACRGAAQAVGESGGLSSRDCAEPDPDAPGLTLCGFQYAGDCGAFADAHACESFAEGGTYYRRCHTSSLKYLSQTPVFLQVVTVYVMP